MGIIREDVDKFVEQVTSLEKAVNGGAIVDQGFLKLDGVEAKGEAKV